MRARVLQPVSSFGLLTEKLVVRVLPGVWGIFLVPIVCLFRAGIALKLVCHRIDSKPTIFVVFLITILFVIFFCLW